MTNKPSDRHEDDLLQTKLPEVLAKAEKGDSLNEGEFLLLLVAAHRFMQASGQGSFLEEPPPLPEEWQKKLEAIGPSLAEKVIEERKHRDQSPQK